MRNYIIIGMITLVCITFGKAQSKKCEEILVLSWKKGGDQISWQEFDVRLSAENVEFSQTIFSKSGSEYRLLVKHVPVIEANLSETGKSTESWKVELRQRYENKENLGENLLRSEGEGSGGDNFPREDLIGYLYPKKTSKIVANGTPLIDGKFYYPILAVRKIQVESFYVIITVTDYKLNSIDNHKVDFLNVHVEFKNK